TPPGGVREYPAWVRGWRPRETGERGVGCWRGGTKIRFKRGAKKQPPVTLAMIDASVAKPAFEYAYRDPGGDCGDSRYSDCSIKSGLQFCSGIVGYHRASCGRPAVCVSKWRIRIGSQLPSAPRS